MRTPNTKNPPGARLKNPIGVNHEPNTVIPNHVPAPSSSLIVPITVSVSVKPRPIPIPSSAESKIVFLLANASALPRMMQFTTIRGMNRPSDL